MACCSPVVAGERLLVHAIDGPHISYLISPVNESLFRSCDVALRKGTSISRRRAAQVINRLIL